MLKRSWGAFRKAPCIGLEWKQWRYGVEKYRTHWRGTQNEKYSSLHWVLDFSIRTPSRLILRAVLESSTTKTRMFVFTEPSESLWSRYPVRLSFYIKDKWIKEHVHNAFGSSVETILALNTVFKRCSGSAMSVLKDFLRLSQTDLLAKFMWATDPRPSFGWSPHFKALLRTFANNSIDFRSYWFNWFNEAVNEKLLVYRNRIRRLQGVHTFWAFRENDTWLDAILRVFNNRKFWPSLGTSWGQSE